MRMGYYEVGGTFTLKRFKKNFYFRLVLFLLSFISTCVISGLNYCEKKIEQKERHEQYVEVYGKWYDAHLGQYGPPPQVKKNNTT